MKLDFKDTYRHWHVGPLVGGVKQPDELHVEPKTDAIRTKLRDSIGAIVTSVGHGGTRYTVHREVGGVYVLTNAKEAS